MAEWLPLIVHLQPPDVLTRIRYQRFSPYHRLAETYGLRLSPSRVYSHIYPLPDDELSELVYLFDDQARAEETTESESRPGLRWLARVFDEWRACWTSSAPPPLLVMKDLGDRIVIVDTRPMA